MQNTGRVVRNGSKGMTTIGNKSVTLAVDARATLGEGAIWHDGSLWWVDIEEGRLHRHIPAAGKNETFELGQKIGTMVPTRGKRLLLALENGLVLFDPDSAESQPFSNLLADRSVMRFNDGKCDPAGRFWVGTMSMDFPNRDGASSLYCFEADGTFREMLNGLTVSNGLCWSVDGSIFYHIDSPTRRIDAFDFDLESGAITNRRTVVEIPAGQGNPDGMTMDVEGSLWVAHWNGGAVACYDPHSGKQLECIELPAQNVTSCAFGGDALQTLYITTARSDEFPLSGGLFAVRPGVCGVKANPFNKE